MSHQQRSINNLPSPRRYNGFTFIITGPDKSLAVVKAWQHGKPVANEPKQAEAVANLIVDTLDVASGYTHMIHWPWPILMKDSLARFTKANFNGGNTGKVQWPT